MITLNMLKKNIGITIPDIAFSLENNIVTLDIKVLHGEEEYDLTGKTITASFNQTGIETGALSVINGIVKLNITSSLVTTGDNLIQLTFRWNADKVEQSPIMTWNIKDSIITTGIDQETVDIVTYLIAENNKAIAAEAERVISENIRIANEVSRKQRMKEALDYQFDHRNVLNESGKNINIDGVGLVSDPVTYMMMQIGGQSSGGWFSPYISGFLGKGAMNEYSGTSIMGTTHCRMGCLDNYFNLISPTATDIHAVGRWRRNQRGLPLPMIDYSYSRRSQNVDFKSRCFSYNETVFIPCSIQGKAGIRWAMQIDKEGMSIKHYVSAHTAGELHMIIISVENSPTKYVFAQYPCNEWYISDTFIDVESDFPSTDSHTSEVSISFGLTFAAGGWSNVNTCYAMSMPEASISDADIQTKIISDLINSDAREASALAYWDTFWIEYKDQWDNVDPKFKSRGLIAVHQIAANTYKGALPSGVPMWDRVFVRDAGWAIIALSKLVPNFCVTYLDWWKKAETLLDSNSYTLDGHREGIPRNNTDNAAVFLAAVGSLWNEIQEQSAFIGIHTQILEALKYCKINFNNTEKHILASHPHDYWDDYSTYGGEMDASLVKYESLVDIWWAYGLGLIIPYLIALGDTDNADYCQSVLEALIEGMEDYRESSGAMQYAIKVDGSLYTDVVASPGTIYAAYLLNDSRCRHALKDENLILRLGVKYLNVLRVMCFSNYRASASVTNKVNVWGPHVPIVAGEMAKLGEYSMLSIIDNSCKFGNWPEDLVVQEDTDDKLVFNQFALNFIWGSAEIIGLCNTLAEL